MAKVYGHAGVGTFNWRLRESGKVRRKFFTCLLPFLAIYCFTMGLFASGWWSMRFPKIGIWLFGVGAFGIVVGWIWWSRHEKRFDKEFERMEHIPSGLNAEIFVAQLLARLPNEFYVLHDLKPDGEPGANIDHIVVGPTGVFAVETKSGKVRIGNGTKNYIGQAKGNAAKLRNLIRERAKVNLDWAEPILCFPFADPSSTKLPNEIIFTNWQTMLEILESPPNPRPLDPAICERIAHSLKSLCAKPDFEAK
jgi:hypothetical protein